MSAFDLNQVAFRRRNDFHYAWTDHGYDDRPLAAVGEAAGFAPEIVGGGGLGWIGHAGQHEICFGFANGPFGYSISTTDGKEVEHTFGTTLKASEEMSESATYAEMAAWLKDRMQKFLNHYSPMYRFTLELKAPNREDAKSAFDEMVHHITTEEGNEPSAVFTCTEEE